MSTETEEDRFMESFKAIRLRATLQEAYEAKKVIKVDDVGHLKGDYYAADANKQVIIFIGTYLDTFDRENYHVLVCTKVDDCYYKGERASAERVAAILKEWNIQNPNE